MDIISIAYAIGVGIIAIVGLYKAWANDKKITKEEIEEIYTKIEELYNSKKE